MKRFNITITNQQTGKVVRTHEDQTENSVLLILEKHGEDRYPLTLNDLLDGESHELNSDEHIVVSYE